MRKTCYTHSMRDTALDEVVLELVRQQIRNVVGLAELLSLTDTAKLRQASIHKLNEKKAEPGFARPTGYHEAAGLSRCRVWPPFRGGQRKAGLGHAGDAAATDIGLYR